jgi:AraC family transcriptional regulator, regulatory protein of adaptative response / DNA-3-methyladenine glycosylase II
MDVKSLDAEHCYQIIKARDARFDGVFYVGVLSTGIYCRPVCTARTPRRDRCNFFANSAAAEVAGFRPCLRCRPELAPGHSIVDAVKRHAGAALVRVQSGALNSGTVDDLARDIGLSARQLRRVVESEFGVSPIALAQTQRLLLAKQLLTDSDLRVIDVAFASGFASVRQFNRVFRSAYQLNPLALRQRPTVSRREHTLSNQPATFELKLGFRTPFAWNALCKFLVSRSSARVERLVGETYVRTISLASKGKLYTGLIAAHADFAHSVLCVQVDAALLPVLPELQASLHRLFDLDASPTVIDSHLKKHSLLKPYIKNTPGLRIPGSVDGFATALRAVLGQQISVKAATTIYGRFVDRFGEVVVSPSSEVNRTPPSCHAVANASLQQIVDLGLTSKRAQTVLALAQSMANGLLHLNAMQNSEATCKQLQALPGIGGWTAQYIAMRALNDPDAFPHTDLGLLKATKVNQPTELLELAESWRPWRAYAAIHLWNHS